MRLPVLDKDDQISFDYEKINQLFDTFIEKDLIYIGSPNWWETMPMPMMTQLEKLDFTAKTVMPFCTHEGSGRDINL